MGSPPFLALFVLIFFFFLDSMAELTAGSLVTLSIPSAYQAGFRGRTVFMEKGRQPPAFRAALSVEAAEGRYVCALAVLLGDVEVWSSRQFAEFALAGSCAVELTAAGVLQVKDSGGRVGWRTATFGQGVEKLKLLRTGNLVLTDASNEIKWQSFDFPGNILLWHQRLTAPAQLSSLSLNSTFSFSLEIEPSKMAMYMKTDKTKYIYWEFMPTRGRQIFFLLLSSSGLKLFDHRHAKIAQILVNRVEPIRFLALGRDGNLGFYHYSPQRGKFEASLQAVTAKCDLPLACGAYGLCTLSNTCRCLQFSQQAESLGGECGQDFNGGFCGGTEAAKMVELEGMTSVLKGVSQKGNASREECERLCLQECSCAAALFSGQGCFLYEIVGGLKQIGGGEGEYLVKVPKKLVSGGKGRRGKKWLLVFGGAMDALIILLIAGGFLWYFVIRKRKRDSENGNN